MKPTELDIDCMFCGNKMRLNVGNYSEMDHYYCSNCKNVKLDYHIGKEVWFVLSSKKEKNIKTVCYLYDDENVNEPRSKYSLVFVREYSRKLYSIVNEQKRFLFFVGDSKVELSQSVLQNLNPQNFDNKIPILLTFC